MSQKFMNAFYAIFMAFIVCHACFSLTHCCLMFSILPYCYSFTMVTSFGMHFSYCTLMYQQADVTII